MSLFNELRRRNVFRVGAAYAVVAWLLLQAADVLLGNFGAPGWVFRSFAALLILGFPLALFLSWAYELTPEGVKRSEDVAAEHTVTPKTGRRIDRLILVGLVAVIALMAVERVWFAEPAQAPPAADVAPPRTDSSPPTDAEERGEKSIAVLPFVNISSDPEQEYFADGMTEELLNVLAKVPLLQVAARTSVFEFKGKSGDVREIGARLGVGHIVEGSVRRDGGQVRVTAQLIRVADGFHVWSDSYDRELKNVFALQDDIARHIAAELKASLIGEEIPAARAAIAPAAYDEYLKGRALYRQRRDLPLAIAHLEAAADEAPEFAAGWSTLSLAHEVARYYTPPAQRAALGDSLNEMRSAAQRAAESDPGAAMTLHALANVARSEGRFGDAEQHYLRALQVDPTYPDAREDYAELLAVVGRFADSLAATRQLLAVEPLVAVFWRRIAFLGEDLDRADLIDEATQRIHEIDPANPFGLLSKFHAELAQGRIESARTTLAEAVRTGSEVAALEDAMLRWALREPGADDAQARDAILEQPDLAVFAVLRGDLDLFFASWENERLRHIRYNFYESLMQPAAHAALADPRAKEMLDRFGFVAYWREHGWPALCRPLGDNDFECGRFAAVTQ